ncbi:MAG: hypothetical protein LBQ88_10195 [Treponema sp.]|jgi:hypothetical protein|nr:hypothetical protein [Treponema sp.]
MDFYNEIRIGKAGEFLTCCDLTLTGFAVFMNERQVGYDLIADTGKKLLRIQVKTCLKPSPIPQRVKEHYAYIYSVRRFGIGGRKSYAIDDVDIFAFVALDIMKVAYVESKNVGQTITFRTETSRGEYHDEIGIACYNKIITFKGKMSQREIAHKFNISEDMVSRMFQENYKPHVTQARYFSDFYRDRKWFLSL